MSQNLDEILLYQKRYLEDVNIYYKLEFWFKGIIAQRLRAFNILMDALKVLHDWVQENKK